jgi:2,5-diamino-6-(ribosylamino)-4(3H)-pyrimidinone 5'-phosphate reductase
MALDDVRPDYLTIEFPEPPEARPYVIVNMVMSADGKTVIEGNERGLGSPSDQFLMRALRSHVDAVFNGANTLRASGSGSDLGGREDLRAFRTARGKPDLPLSCVITNSGDVPLERKFFTSREFEGIVFAGHAMPADRRAAIEATGRQVVTMPAEDPERWALGWLRRERGVRLLLVEGGATLNGSLIDDDLVDEVFLTVGPSIVGGDTDLTAVRGKRPTSFEGVRPLTLVSAIPNPGTSEVYLRYRVQPQP